MVCTLKKYLAFPQGGQCIHCKWDSFAMHIRGIYGQNYSTEFSLPWLFLNPDGGLYQYYCK